MAISKPGDLLLGVMDFFSLLLPGAVLVGFLSFSGRYGQSGSFLQWLGLEGLSGTPAWAAFLLAAFIAGHILNGLSSLLDKAVYDSIFVKRWKRRRGPDPLYVAAKQQMADDLGPDKEITNTYWWAATVVRTSSPAGASEVERLAADSKFFRSLVIALAVASFGSPRMVALLLSALVAFSLWRYCELRWKATERLYEYYVLLSRRAQVAALKEASKQEDSDGEESPNPGRCTGRHTPPGTP